MEKKILEVTVFADGLDHPECVAVHPDGSVWAGGEAGQVYQISADGKQIKEVANTGGFNLGIAFSPLADWLAICDNKNKCVWKYDLLTGVLTCFSSAVEGVPMSIPNYPAFDRKGNLYVSDSGTFRKVNGRVYKFDIYGNGVVWHKGPFSFANGMALSVDQQVLYVVCTWLPGVEQIKILPDGSAGERSVLIEIPKTCPDGIALDEEGNKYISCYTPNTIYKLNSAGELSTFIHDWESHTLCNPTNIAFGGKDKKRLYVAGLGRWHIALIDTDTPGLSLY
ncbi:MAG: SMP-30/gluconolactonase/LRE family protein [Ginsengibacter sp.]